MPQDQRQRTANPSMLLIDEVMTTGANLYEAAKTLHQAGTGPVRGLVLARVLRHGLYPLLCGADFSIERYDRAQVLQYDIVVVYNCWRCSLAPMLAASNEAEMAKIEIYTAMACPFCTRAVKLLNAKNIVFEEIDVTLSAAKRQTMLSRANGRTSVPQIFINDDYIGGCDDLFALDQAGHLDKLLSMAS